MKDDFRVEGDLAKADLRLQSVVAGRFIKNVNVYEIKRYQFPAQAGIAWEPPVSPI